VFYNFIYLLTPVNWTLCVFAFFGMEGEAEVATLLIAYCFCFHVFIMTPKIDKMSLEIKYFPNRRKYFLRP